MNGPLAANGVFGEQFGFIVAFFVGGLFGFFLERAGFGSAKKLTADFYGRDMAVLKVMFTAIVVAMVGVMYLGIFGRLDISLVTIPPTFLWPQIVGGLIFGVGFVMGGYCPGTAVVAAGSGRKDALWFLLGILVGIGVWAEGYPLYKEFYVSGSYGVYTLSQWLGLPSGVVAFAVILMALGAFWFATYVERLMAAKALRGKDQSA
ncbi:MAG: YeeE/YedE thiosulfate transporter family protein [Fimbriimonas sp.]|nr:YeeE/YedE thiosulfate transporter family protein [Fimbriimonas sp.]